MKTTNPKVAAAVEAHRAEVKAHRAEVKAHRAWGEAGRALDKAYCAWAEKHDALTPAEDGEYRAIIARALPAGGAK